MAIEGFAYPKTLEEALVLLGDPSRRAIPVGGGTGLVGGGRRGAALLVDITRCGLDRVDVRDNAIHLGAAVRASRIARAAWDGASGTLLVEAARSIATEPIRNAVTLGGNIVHLCSWAAMPVALLATGAMVHVAEFAGQQTHVDIGDLVAQHPLKRLGEGTLITGISIPTHRAKAGGAAFMTFRATTADYPLISVAVRVAFSNGKCDQAAVAVGAATVRPVRVGAAERVLVESDCADFARARKAAREAGEAAKGAVEVASDMRISVPVRRRILGVLVERACLTAIDRARPGEEEAA